MDIKTIDQTIRIEASAEKVWQALWDKENYKKWADAFMPGSYYMGNLQQGERIKFIDPDHNGMESNVDSVTENREISFSHLHELAGDEEGQSLGNMNERYLLEEQNGVTTLTVKSDMPKQYFNDMDASMKKALQIVKELAEA